MDFFPLILLAFSLIGSPSTAILDKTSDVKGEIIGRYANLQIDDQVEDKGQEIADNRDGVEAS